METPLEVIAPSKFTEVLLLDWNTVHKLARRIGSEYCGWVLESVFTMPTPQRVMHDALVMVRATWTRKRICALTPGGWRRFYLRVFDVD